MRVLPHTLVRDLEQYDPSIVVLWNQRLNRNVVVQDLRKVRPDPWRSTGSEPDLVGCPAIQGERHPYKLMFVCQSREGVPLEPGPWIIRELQRKCPRKDDKAAALRLDEANVRADQRDEADDREFYAQVEHDLSRNLDGFTVVDFGARR